MRLLTITAAIAVALLAVRTAGGQQQPAPFVPDAFAPVRSMNDIPPNVLPAAQPASNIVIRASYTINPYDAPAPADVHDIRGSFRPIPISQANGDADADDSQGNDAAESVTPRAIDPPGTGAVPPSGGAVTYPYGDTTYEALAMPTDDQGNPCGGGCSDCGCNGGCGQCGGCNRGCGGNNCFNCCWTPEWEVLAASTLMQRDRPRSSHLFADGNSGTVFGNANAFNFNWQPGMDFTLRRGLSRDISIEGRYFGTESWTDSESFPTVSVPGNPINATQLSNISANYGSRLFSTEFNVRRRWNNWFTVMVGFRWIDFSERLDVNSTANVAGPPGIVGLSNHTSTLNQMYGGQVGCDWRWLNEGCWHLNCQFKTGVYGNSAHSAFDTSSTGGFDLSNAFNASQTAFMEEIGIRAVYQWTSHVALHAGYDWMWLENVAIASNQNVNLLGSNSALDTSGRAFFYGSNIGVDLTW